MKQINYLLLITGLTCLSFSSGIIYTIKQENKYPY